MLLGGAAMATAASENTKNGSIEHPRHGRRAGEGAVLVPGAWCLVPGAARSSAGTGRTPTASPLPFDGRRLCAFDFDSFCRRGEGAQVDNLVAARVRRVCVGAGGGGGAGDNNPAV